MRAAAVFATFPSRAGVAAIYAYNEAVATMKDADLDNLTLDQDRAKRYLETHRTQYCACCRYSRSAIREKKIAELRACLKKMKDECIDEECEICHEKFVEGDQWRIEFDHRDQATKSFKLSDFQRIEMFGGVSALELERLKCRPLHYSCHRQHSFLQLVGLGNYAIDDISDSMLNLMRGKKEIRKYIRRRKLGIGKCQCGCNREVTERNWMCFDFAHTPGEGDIHKVKCVSNCNFGEIEAEIAKCRLLFCECHKEQETDPGRITWQKVRGL